MYANRRQIKLVEAKVEVKVSSEGKDSIISRKIELIGDLTTEVICRKLWNFVFKHFAPYAVTKSFMIIYPHLKFNTAIIDIQLAICIYTEEEKKYQHVFFHCTLFKSQ